MCQFVSWIQDRVTGKITFLTDKAIEEYCDAQDIYPVPWCDFIGHFGIERVLGARGEHIELDILGGYPIYRDARNIRRNKLPRKITAALRAGEMNKMADAMGFKFDKYTITAKGGVERAALKRLCKDGAPGNKYKYIFGGRKGLLYIVPSIYNANEIFIRKVGGEIYFEPLANLAGYIEGITFKLVY